MLWRYLICLLAGGLLPLAFAPFNIYSLAFFAPAFLLFFWLQVTPKQAAKLGFFFGLGFFGAGISWVYLSIHNFGNASVLLASGLTLFVVCVMSLHFVIFGYVFRKLFRHKKRIYQCLLAFPALWVAFELVNVSIFGFPWLLIGYSQITNPLSGLAPIIGVYGLSLCVTAISGSLVLLVSERKKASQIAALSTILLLIAFGLVLENHTWTKPVGKPISASLIQGNIPQTIKWDPNFALQNIDVYKELTLKHLNSQLIVWPEGALPLTAENIPAFTRLLSNLAKQHHATIIFGAPSENKKTKQFYNAIFMIGKHRGKYLKRHLVPFGEYTPFRQLIKPLADAFNMQLYDLSHGPDQQPDLQLSHFKIAPFICYEITFPQEALNHSEHTQLLLTISDDSWFGRSIALDQHLQMAQMRSLETGRYMLIATNTGITAAVSPLGKVIKHIPIDQRRVISTNVTPMMGKTPLMVWHYYPVFGAAFIMILLGLLL